MCSQCRKYFPAATEPQTSAAAAAAAAAYYLYKNKKEDEPEEVVRVSHAEALEKTTAALKAVGWDDEGARVQASIMVSSEACGNNQGLVKMFKPELMAPAPGAGTLRHAAGCASLKGEDRHVLKPVVRPAAAAGEPSTTRPTEQRASAPRSRGEKSSSRSGRAPRRPRRAIYIHPPPPAGRGPQVPKPGAAGRGGPGCQRFEDGAWGVGL